MTPDLVVHMVPMTAGFSMSSHIALSISVARSSASLIPAPMPKGIISGSQTVPLTGKIPCWKYASRCFAVHLDGVDVDVCYLHISNELY